jgi:branched-chain amino acid transport system substrate-binding protein
MSQGVLHSISRRRVLQGAAAGGLAAVAPALFRPAFAVPETVKIGLVGPRTGSLALFYQEMGWTIDAVKKFTGNEITINGTKHPLEIVVKDSQSNPNRASEVARS